MTSDPAFSLGRALGARRGDIIAAWQIKMQPLFAERPDVASLLRGEATEFLTELSRFIGDDLAQADETKDFAGLTAFVENASLAHAREGLTSSETLRFILAFRDVMTSVIAETFVADQARVAGELVRMGAIVDRLAAEAVKANGRARETMIERQSRTILDLSTPILQIWPQILLMPLVGVVDTRRAQQVMEDLLTAISRERALIAILDVTGVPIIDTRVALHLTKTVAAANMLGTKVIMTGISPDAAQTLVKLDIDLRSVVTRGTLHAGLVEALRSLGQAVGLSAGGSDAS